MPATIVRAGERPRPERAWHAASTMLCEASETGGAVVPLRRGGAVRAWARRPTGTTGMRPITSSEGEIRLRGRRRTREVQARAISITLPRPEVPPTASRARRQLARPCPDLSPRPRTAPSFSRDQPNEVRIAVPGRTCREELPEIGTQVTASHSMPAQKASASAADPLRDVERDLVGGAVRPRRGRPPAAVPSAAARWPRSAAAFDVAAALGGKRRRRTPRPPGRLLPSVAEALEARPRRPGAPGRAPASRGSSTTRSRWCAAPSRRASAWNSLVRACRPTAARSHTGCRSAFSWTGTRTVRSSWPTDGAPIVTAWPALTVRAIGPGIGRLFGSQRSAASPAPCRHRREHTAQRASTASRARTEAIEAIGLSSAASFAFPWACSRAASSGPRAPRRCPAGRPGPTPALKRLRRGRRSSSLAPADWPRASVDLLKF